MKKNYLSLTVVIPMYNAQSTIEAVLESVKIQKYPIKEYIIVDNNSSDDSIKVVERFKNKNKVLKIRVVKRHKTFGVGSSYNLAAKKALNPYLIFLHSDSILPTENEVEKLVEPFGKISNVIATYPHVAHPKYIWDQYNFWQKYQFAQVVGTSLPAMLGKFDCYSKSAFAAVGGYDIENFIDGIGSEDANLHFKLQKKGKVISTEAEVIHVHYLGKDYNLGRLISTRKLMARTYGRLIRVNWKDLKQNNIVFLIKPILAIGTLIYPVSIYFLVIDFVFNFLYVRKMYFDTATVLNPRIILLPFVTVFFIYYETFWMIESFLFIKKGV